MKKSEIRQAQNAQKEKLDGAKAMMGNYKQKAQKEANEKYSQEIA